MSMGFQTALSAITTAQRALQVIGHNLTNAATPGYTRQRVQLSALAPTTSSGNLWIGRGVGLTAIERVTDDLLLGRIRAQGSEVSRQGTVRAHLMELESVFQEPGPNGLASVMAQFHGSLSALSSDPDDSGLRTAVLQGGRGLADSFQLLQQQLTGVGASFESAVDAEVNAINNLAHELAGVNNEIAANRINGEIPPGLLDHQEALLRELSSHVDVQASRDASGRLNVVTGSLLLVSPRGVVDLEVQDTGLASDGFRVKALRGSADFRPKSGKLRALMDLAKQSTPERLQSLNKLAGNMIFEFNRRHSTGLPPAGGFTQLTSTSPFVDVNGSGNVSDDRLFEAGLPFDISSGELVVNTTNTATGVVTRTRIAIDPTTMTVGDLRTALDNIPGLDAVVDPTGTMRLQSASGTRFDFSNRVLPKENLGRTFGAAEASIVAGSGPFNFSAAGSMTVAVDGNAPQTINFAPGSFAVAAAATVQEVAAAINAQVAGAGASVVDGRLVLRSNSTGTTSSLQVTDGAGMPAAALGLSTTLETGSDHSVNVGMSGTYAGAARTLKFVPLGSGTIGVTPGLQVEARDAVTGQVVGILDVGQGYTPGSDISLIDGAKISFSAGQLDRASGETFSVALIDDGDSADVLAAIGMNSFFTGNDASNIGVNAALEADPMLFAAGLDVGSSNNGNLLRMMAVQDLEMEGLGNASAGSFYRSLITELGGESARSASALETQSLVMESLEAKRESESGVNLDEELLLMEQFQQLYQVAGRYLQTMQEVNDTLLDMAR
ncbi:MAG: flagellar hook-associated protein FlgK [Planctomycetes bacterium]|nr:flagellar hook-associated protein FlgK [Planctomycetota bacterium]